VLAAAKQHSDRVVQIGLQHQSGGALADTRQWLSQGLAGKITLVESWMSRNSRHGQGQWVRDVPTDCHSAECELAGVSRRPPGRGFRC